MNTEELTPESLSKSLADKLDWSASVSSFLVGLVSYLLGFGFAYALLAEPPRAVLQGNLYYFVAAFCSGIGFGLILLYVGWIFVVGAWFAGMLLYQWRTKGFRSLQEDIIRMAISNPR
jgi:hypothetical protein